MRKVQCSTKNRKIKMVGAGVKLREKNRNQVINMRFSVFMKMEHQVSSQENQRLCGFIKYSGDSIFGQVSAIKQYFSSQVFTGYMDIANS